MKKLILLVVIFLLTNATAMAYDQQMAESYAQFFKPFSEKATSKSLQMMKTPDFVKAVKAGQLFVLDIRTPGETGIYGITIPGSIRIPMNHVFYSVNLARLPTNQKIVVVCKAGHRAIAVSTALRHIGFNNVYSLKLGIQDLAKYLSPKTAY
jgi:rhodanese-related sulfurtransferase